MADLKVTITEALKLQGNNQGATHTKTISGINEASRRVVAVRAHDDGTTLCSFADTDGAGTFKHDNVKYVRITNLDSSNYIILSLEENATGTGDAHTADKMMCQIKLEAGKSFMLGVMAIDNHDSSSSFLNVNLEDLTGIRGRAYGAAVNTEVFIAAVTA